MAVIFQVEVLCVVTPCCVVLGHRRFRGTCCLHVQGENSTIQQIHYRFHKRPPLVLILN